MNYREFEIGSNNDSNDSTISNKKTQPLLKHALTLMEKKASLSFQLLSLFHIYKLFGSFIQ